MMAVNIRVSSILTIGIAFAISLVIASVTIPMIISFDLPETIFGYIFYAFLLTLSALFLIAGLFLIQYAEFSSGGIRVKSLLLLFKTIKIIESNSIVMINRKDMETLNSHGFPTYESWIVFHTNLSQGPIFEKSKKGKEPFSIIANPKNLTTVKDWATQYTPHAIINLEQQSTHAKLPHDQTET